jgi:hypothetical protein
LVRQIAKENGYTYILELSAVIIAAPGDDLMPLAKRSWELINSQNVYFKMPLLSIFKV